MREIIPAFLSSAATYPNAIPLNPVPILPTPRNQSRDREGAGFDSRALPETRSLTVAARWPIAAFNGLSAPGWHTPWSAVTRHSFWTWKALICHTAAAITIVRPRSDLLSERFPSTVAVVPVSASAIVVPVGSVAVVGALPT